MKCDPANCKHIENLEARLRASEANAVRCPSGNTDLHLAAILLNRHAPLAPHHVGWIRERLGYPTDDKLADAVRTGKWPN
jgi:hypothetical protein